MTDAELARAIRKGSRRAISRAITLVESTRLDHRQRTEWLLGELVKFSSESVRLGITGVPGVGKSTFIEAIGTRLIDQGKRVAVLSIDPSSVLSGGSILGDKTRMEVLSKRPEAFIRPSPSAGSLGGVARRTRESIIILEAAGFDFIIIETVGVGQSETLVANMTDMFLLLLLPAGGDELQGIKRGIMELADIVIVNKSDDEFVSAASRAVAEFQHALRLLQKRYREWTVPVLSCSARDHQGIDIITEKIDSFVTLAKQQGVFDQHRRQQRVQWFHDELNTSLLDLIDRNDELRDAMERSERQVLAGDLTAASAARGLIETLFKTPREIDD